MITGYSLLYLDLFFLLDLRSRFFPLFQILLKSCLLHEASPSSAFPEYTMIVSAHALSAISGCKCLQDIIGI